MTMVDSAKYVDTHMIPTMLGLWGDFGIEQSAVSRTASPFVYMSRCSMGMGMLGQLLGFQAHVRGASEHLSREPPSRKWQYNPHGLQHVISNSSYTGLGLVYFSTLPVPCAY